MAVSGSSCLFEVETLPTDRHQFRFRTSKQSNILKAVIIPARELTAVLANCVGSKSFFTKQLVKRKTLL